MKRGRLCIHLNTGIPTLPRTTIHPSTSTIHPSMTELGAFCTCLIDFFEDISSTYSEEPKLASATNALKLLKKANPRMIYNYFMKDVYTEFRDPILAKNEALILRRAHEILSSEYADINYAFWIFDKHWKDMTDSNKDAIWKHMQVLVILAGKVSPT